MLLSTSYLPPSWYFKNILLPGNFIIEANEHFIKQTIRNRCHILSPNGVQQLVVPVVHDNRSHTPVKDIRIANDHPWQRQHWRSLNAAYRRSAFFEFYMDDFAPFYHTQYQFLLDFNTVLLNLLLEALTFKKEISFTEAYLPAANEQENDFQRWCDSGNPEVGDVKKQYPQVFGYKNGFVPGLSMVDLLFNTGRNALEYLE